ncbi:short-chain dehydrogenase [Pestalotiopsis sp. NC0098]|nr:short-chain dehydrogenase [Pestalotiopsis sp. NC0098]
MPATRRLTILITGCSPGGMGAALAMAFHRAGHHIFATARDISKLSTLASQGIETLSLDVTSASSIASAVDAVERSLASLLGADGASGMAGLDILINNAGGHYTAPISDASLTSAKSLFDLNVWAQLEVTQALLPLLLKSRNKDEDGLAVPMIVNHTSVGSVAALPFQGIYSASKAAFARLSDAMRLEFAPLGIRVVELKTAMVITNFINNSQHNNVEGKIQQLPEGSLYEVAREVVQEVMSQDQFNGRGITADQWAAGVMGDLMQRNPPAIIWRGQDATWGRMMGLMPTWVLDGILRKMMKLDVVEQILEEDRKD